jgi:hypothetical protein
MNEMENTILQESKKTQLQPFQENPEEIFLAGRKKYKRIAGL